MLRKEKTELTAQCKKQQAREHHMEQTLHTASEEVRVKQAQLETLRYEMTAAARRASAESAMLRERVASVELELSATRREADEYHKAAIEKSSELAALDNKATTQLKFIFLIPKKCFEFKKTSEFLSEN